MSSKKYTFTLAESGLLSLQLCEETIQLVMGEGFKIRHVTFKCAESGRGKTLHVRAEVFLKYAPPVSMDLPESDYAFVITLTHYKVEGHWRLAHDASLAITSTGKFCRQELRELVQGTDGLTLIGKPFAPYTG